MTRPQNRLHLTPSEQGRRWRSYGGARTECWHRTGTTARVLWQKGWDDEDRRQTGRDSKQTYDQGTVACPTEEGASDR